MRVTNLLIIMLVALVAPLVVDALPALRVPSPVGADRLTGFVMSFAIAPGVALLPAAGGFASAPLLVAIILCATGQRVVCHAAAGTVVPGGAIRGAGTALPQTAGHAPHHGGWVSAGHLAAVPRSWVTHRFSVDRSLAADGRRTPARAALIYLRRRRSGRFLHLWADCGQPI